MRLLFLCTATAALVAGCMSQRVEAHPAAHGLAVERVVMLMRHGVRPPTRREVTPAGIAAQEWPAWETPYGHLTQHGYAAVRLLAAYDRAAWEHDRLLPHGRCPAAGDVVVWSDTDERTIRTGDALIEGLAPGCAIANGHLPEGDMDPLFSPLDAAGSIDTARAQEAIVAENGSLGAVQQAHRPELDALARVLGCCSAAACQAVQAASPCGLVDMPSAFAESRARPKLTGPLDFGPTAAQTLMLEYVEGLPMAEVGWGRASRDDIELIMRLHAMKGDVLQRPPYIAARGAGPLLRRMLAALTTPGGENGRRLTVLVGHDTNISDMSGLLRFTWQVRSYPADTPPPGGAFGLMLVRDDHGARFVRAFYRSQTMDQVRNLTPLSLESPPSVQWVTIEGCGRAEDATSCSLDAFSRLAAERLALAN